MLTECTNCGELNAVEDWDRARCDGCGCLLPAPELIEEDA